MERDGAMRVAALLLAVLALVAAGADKRAEMSPVPFVLGSRYGRSPGPRLLLPRNDRFFMGSRYGKRAGPDSGALGAPAGGAPAGAPGGALAPSLLREPLGALYRCRPEPLYLHDNRRLEEESILSDEE